MLAQFYTVNIEKSTFISICGRQKIRETALKGSLFILVMYRNAPPNRHDKRIKNL